MAIDKNTIIEASDIQTGTISIPEWGGDCFVKKPSIKERDILGTHTRIFMEVKTDGKGKQKNEFVKGEESEKAFAAFRLKTVGFALCDEKGNRLFNDDEIDTLLGKKSPEVIDRIFNDLGNAFGTKEA
ncbi:MAG: hypothetical protein ACYDD5_12360, partial [Sulfuricurvum sp.]